MIRGGLGVAVLAACGAMGLGSSEAKADHNYRRSCGSYGHVSYAPSYYRPVYAAPVVYTRPVTYVEPVYYPTVTYVERPVYYPPVRVVRPYSSVVQYGNYSRGHNGHHRTYGGYIGSGGAGFSYGSRDRAFSFSVGR